MKNRKQKIHKGKGSNKWVEYQKERREKIGYKQYKKSYCLRNLKTH